MKTRTYKFRLISLFLFLFGVLSFASFASPLTTVGEEEQFTTDTMEYAVYHGILRDSESKEPLIFASVIVKGTNVATISNGDGEFTLKIGKQSKAKAVQVSHIGYKTFEVPITSLRARNNKLFLTKEVVPLKAINIYPYDADFLVRHIMSNLSKNYPDQANMMKGFYRETIKKNKSYVGISEAVVDIYKAGYTDARKDQVQIFKGRKSEDVTKMDTLVFKLQGGPATVLLFDIIKSPSSLLTDEYFNEYLYAIESIIMIDEKPHYVVNFKQRKGAESPLYNGIYYIETNTLALTRAEFSLNLEDEIEATNMLIRKKPVGLKVTAKRVNYIVQFREQDEKWYFSYARGEMVFKFNWKKRLFNTYYTAMMEIAVTDRSAEAAERFKRGERFKSNQILSDEVSQFGDEDFWGHHNTIEPDESIQSAIKKLKNKGRL